MGGTSRLWSYVAGQFAEENKHPQMKTDGKCAQSYNKQSSLSDRYPVQTSATLESLEESYMEGFLFLPPTETLGILYQLSHKGNPRILEWVA